MTLRVYNTLTNQKEVFEPVTAGKVGMYLCGPTVYKPPHVGHLVGPVIFDAIKRYLTFKGFEVTWVVNITDVDDKIIDRASELKTTWMAVAEECTAQYFAALAMLGVDTIDRFPKASEHIGEIIAMCEKLIAQGYSYAADGNVWFDVLRDADYGKLSNRKVEQQESGTRDLAGSGKKNPADFALWKAAKPGEPSWPSPWGPGRPGWHIECSAMAIKYLGDTFDIHGGGMDLMFPHHENELAQAECCTGKQFVKYWLHNGLTRIATKLPGGQVRSEKMSKSIGNTLDPNELVAEHGAEFVRYLLLSTHYRRPIDFSDDVVASSKKGLASFERLFERLSRLAVGAPQDAASAKALATANSTGEGAQLSGLSRIVSGLRAKFLESMDDDFNTAGAIGAMHEIASAINSHVERTKIEAEPKPHDVAEAIAAGMTLRELSNLLGLFREDAGAPRAGSKQLPRAAGAAAASESAIADQLMQLIIELRASARQTKNFAMADAIRDGLAKLKITLEDRAGGTIWRKS